GRLARPLGGQRARRGDDQLQRRHVGPRPRGRTERWPALRDGDHRPRHRAQRPVPGRGTLCSGRRRHHPVRGDHLRSERVHAAVDHLVRCDGAWPSRSPDLRERLSRREPRRHAVDDRLRHRSVTGKEIGNGGRPMRTAFAVAALAVAWIVMGGTTSATHAFSGEFDATKPVTLRGAVTKVEWITPLSWLYLDVKDPATGKVSSWKVEMGAPNQLLRR